VEEPAFPRLPRDLASLGKNDPRALLWELNEVLGREVLVDILSGGDAIPRRHPTKNILVIIRNWPNRGDGLHGLAVKSVSQKLHIPRLGVKGPQVGDCGRKRCSSDRQQQMVMDGVPDRAPRSRPDRSVPAWIW